MADLAKELRRIDLAHTGFTEDYCPPVARKTIRAAAAAIEAGADDAVRDALKCAVSHIEHMAAWIGRLKSGYSFESLGEDMPSIQSTLDALSSRRAFQDRVHPWMLACFGEEISGDVAERNHRFLEEALELVQSTGCTASEAHQLVDYVFNRPKGETHQEIGGVMVTLAALCLAIGQDMHAAGETELARIWTKVGKIRAKQAAKPKHSPLPQYAEADALPADVVRLVIAARIVAFEDQSKEALNELDKASEAFAERVPWDDDPNDIDGAEEAVT